MLLSRLNLLEAFRNNIGFYSVWFVSERQSNRVHRQHRATGVVSEKRFAGYLHQQNLYPFKLESYHRK